MATSSVVQKNPDFRDLSKTLLSAADNSSNSPQMAAPRRSREIDQSMQRFHVGCGYANHGILLILDDTLNCSLLMGEMILNLTNQAVFVTLSVVTIPHLAQQSLF